MEDRFNVKFVVEDNSGKKYVTKEYNIFERIKNNDFLGENEILENAEELISCDCTLNESNTQCDCENRFDEGKIVQMLQCTGLKDRTQKPIFEKDKILFEPYWRKGKKEGTIIFYEGSFGIETSAEFLSFGRQEVQKMFKSFEVIGNIYENENLLKEVENGK